MPHAPITAKRGFMRMTGAMTPADALGATKRMSIDDVEVQESVVEDEKPYKNADWLRERYWSDGLSTVELGQLCGVDSVTIHNWLKRHEIPRRPPGGGDPDERLDDPEWLSEIYHTDGLSISEIADYCDCGQSTVYRRMKSHGIQTKEQQQATPSGKQHWAYKDGSSVGGRDREFGPNWEEKSEKARERDGNKCQRCGITGQEHRSQHGQKLHVHHITPRSEFEDGDGLNYERPNRLSNLITLCARCHVVIEDLPIDARYLG